MKLEAHILEAAATWYVDLRSATASDPLHEAHRQWLAEDPRHREAWQRMQKLQKNLSQLPREVNLDTLNNARRSRRAMIKTLAVVLTVGGTGSLWQQRTRLVSLAADYRTSTGQRQEITLADSTQVQLNTDTAIDVRYSNEQRVLVLHRGEVMVSTGQDSHGRPFFVHSAHGQIEALGTRFMVKDSNGKTQVSVFEHAVQLQASDAAKAVALQAGQSADFSSRQYSQPVALPANADAWTKGLLIVSNWRLADFIEELNRYHKGKLSCDQKVADYRISGAFYLDDTHSVLENLSSTLPVKVRYLTRLWARVEAT